MSLPIITWHIREDEDYIQDHEYYLGSYNSESAITLNVQVWNNRYGQKDVDSIENARLALYFDTAEDSVLFNYCTITVEHGIPMQPEIELNKIVADIGKLSGEPNNGVASDKNRNNYKNISIVFDKLPNNLKNGLKNMYLDIELN